VDEPEAEAEDEEGSDGDEERAYSRQAQEQRNLLGALPPTPRFERDPGDNDSRDQGEGTEQMEEEGDVRCPQIHAPTDCRSGQMIAR